MASHTTSPDPRSARLQACTAVAEALARLFELVAEPEPRHQRLLRPEEAAEALGISRATVFKEIASGKLRSALVGGRRRISESDLEAFIEASRGDVR
jgi:excisionase family DNA binding protein